MHLMSLPVDKNNLLKFKINSYETFRGIKRIIKKTNSEYIVKKVLNILCIFFTKKMVLNKFLLKVVIRSFLLVYIIYLSF